MFFAERVPPIARYAYKRDAVAGMLAAVMGSLTGPFFAVIARGVLKASAFEISLLTVVPLVGSALSLVWAHLMEGRRKMPFAVWSWIAARAMFLLGVFATTSLSFVLLVTISAIVASVSGPAYSALMKEIYPDSDRAAVMGYARVCTVGAGLIVVPVAGFLLAGHNYRFVFPLSVVFGIASALVFNKIPTSDTHGDPSVPFLEFVRNAFAVLHEDRGFRRFCTGIFVAGSANFMISALITIYQVDTLGVDTKWQGAFSFVSSACLMYGYIYWGNYIDRRTSQNAIAVQTVILALIPLAYCVVTEAWMVFPVVVIGAAVMSGMDLSYANGIMQYAPEDRVTHYWAVFTSLIAVRGMVAPFVGVFLYDIGVPIKSIFLVAAGVMLIGAAIQYGGVLKPAKPTSDR